MNLEYSLFVALLFSLWAMFYVIWWFQDYPRFYFSGIAVQMSVDNDDVVLREGIYKNNENLFLRAKRKKIFWQRELHKDSYKLRLVSVRAGEREYEYRELDSIFIEKHVHCDPP